MDIYIYIYTFFFLCIYLDIETVPLNTKKVIVFFWVVVFTLFRGLRWQCGTDWEQFLDVFNASSWENIFSYNRYNDDYMEPGYMFLNIAVKSLGGSYTTFLIVTNLFIMSSYSKFVFKYSRLPIVALVALMSVDMLFPVRQSIAVAITLYAYPYIFNKKNLIFIIIVLLAILVHYSAIVVLFIFFLRNYRFSYKQVIVIFIGSVLIGHYVLEIISVLINRIYLLESISSKVETYSNISHSMGDVFGLRSYVNVAMSFILLILFYSIKNNKSEKKDVINYFFNIFFVSVIISNLFLFHMRDFVRLQGYFQLMSGILFTYFFIELFERYNFNKMLIYTLFIAFMCYRLFNSFHPFNELYVPYQSIFDFRI